MHGILLISTIYPLPSRNNKGTAVCHYFAREWVKMGYDVRVVHYQAVYPMLFYWMARLNQKRIVAKTGAVVYTSRDKGAVYEMDGVPVNRIPLFKWIPHGPFSRKAVKRSINQIVSWCKATGFVPNVITGHFPNPQVEVVGQLKSFFSLATTAIVMHGDIELTKKVYGDKLLDMCRKIDVWGFRSEPVHKSFERHIMPVERFFICYSGIPEGYITENNPHSFEPHVQKFVYVGEMIERKYPIQVLDALEQTYPDGDYEMIYVGDGQLLNNIHNRVQKENLSERVKVLGKIPREKIKEQYDKADCMVMISRGEAYGLVYLEAMARGCITIASRNEGFDGIIKDGINGFLCNAGDADELASIIMRIRNLPREELFRISNAAISTARWLTDTNAAKMYADELFTAIE